MLFSGIILSCYILCLTPVGFSDSSKKLKFQFTTNVVENQQLHFCYPIYNPHATIVALPYVKLWTQVMNSRAAKLTKTKKFAKNEKLNKYNYTSISHIFQEGVPRTYDFRCP